VKASNADLYAICDAARSAGTHGRDYEPQKCMATLTPCWPTLNWRR
jgi:hypothetical protein